MYMMRWALLGVVLCVAGTVWAEEEPAPNAELLVEAEEAAPAEPLAASEDGEQVESMVNREINIDLIDLNRLREVVEGQAGSERLRLTLDECVRMALEKNQQILVTEFEPLKTERDIFAAKGEFDPMFNVSANYIRATQALSPEYKKFGGIDTADVFRTMGTTSVAGKLQTGTIYNLQFDLSKEETTWNSFVEEYNGSLTLTMDQPLLRGRGKKVNRIRIEMAKYGREAAEHQLRLAVMTTVAEVVKAYWDLVGAVEAVKVREESLANADRLLEISKKRLDIGTGAAIEVLQAKAGVAMRQSDLIATRSRVSDAEDMLKTLLDLRDEDVMTFKRIVPVDRPKVAPFEISDIEKSEETVRQSIAVALEKRPEMLLSEIEIANAKLDIDRTADGMLPEFNLTGSVSQGGRDHKAREVFNDVRERTDNAYTVGFRGSVPIGNRIARGTYERALLTLRQAEQRREQTKQELMLKVRLASRAAYTSQILVESNRQARALQETNVVAEEKRLRLGVSTSYRVLQIQEDLTAAQTQELQAQIAYEKALVEVRLAEGTILDHLGIDFGVPENEKPISYVDSVKPDWKPVETVSGWIDDIGCKESCEEEVPASDQAEPAPATEEPAPVEEAPAES